MKFLFLIFPFFLFSQSVFDIKTEPIYIDAKSVDEIREFTLDSIYPYIYTNIPSLKTLDVVQRKKKFIQLILPAILFEKSKIRKALKSINDDSVEELYLYCNCKSRDKLIECLSNQPNSIILAQAAIESGWGTSRFFIEGLNLFGVHSYNKTDLRMQAIGTTISSPVYVKKYNDISSSISDYLRTLAKSHAYTDFRMHRKGYDSVLNLIKYLTHYSERREQYVKDLELIIKHNNLFIYDSLDVDWE